jgi:hypothetical protein
MGRKARREAKGRSLRERRNAADRPESPIPQGLREKGPSAALRASAS